MGIPLSHSPPLLNQMHISPLELLHRVPLLDFDLLQGNCSSMAASSLLSLPNVVISDMDKSLMTNIAVMTPVEILMDSVKAAEPFPSVVATSKTLAVVSSRLRGDQGDALHFDTIMLQKSMNIKYTLTLAFHVTAPLRSYPSLESELSKKLEITENAKEENDEEEEGSKAETSTTKKKKNKNKSKKKPHQTDLPTIPIVKFFPSGDFP
ncbi:hypothetical protein DY000_02022595 [Brassica cretica]|uniref:BURP domain-containing protein n=1 Tax=Brassica cretica TaxID=69181 RepID=A0ABQ7EK47_BRACR|nr:hypothetical protein DY000_02022595 [Brassica cretica]